MPHLAGKYKLYISEYGKDSLDRVENMLFQPFKHQFVLEQKGATPKALTSKQKTEILQLFHNIIEQVKSRRDDIQHVRKTQPMARGEKGSIYLAKWNGKVQHWENELLTKHKDVLGQYLSAPFCPKAAFNTKLAVAELKQLGIGYVFGKAEIQEKNLTESLANAEKEIKACKNE